MAKVISVINMKGGVGKTTLTVNLAWTFYFSKYPRVLIIDLDPQFNASQYLLGPTRYKKRIITDGLPTVWDIFEQNTKTPDRTSHVFNKETVRHYISSDSKRSATFDIVPSRLELSYSLKNPVRKEELLSDFISSIQDDYDIILIDCAPTDSFLTTSAYLASDSILIPVKPEYLSSIGLPLIESSLKSFSQEYNKDSPKVLGILFNFCDGYLPEENVSKRDVRKVAKDLNWNVFETEIPYSRSFPKGAREKEPIFWTKHARSKVKDKIFKLLSEVISKMA